MKYATLELGTVEAVFNKLGGMDGAKRFLADELTLVPKEPKKLLQLVTTSPVLAMEGFKVADYFKVDTKKAATQTPSTLCHGARRRASGAVSGSV